MAHRYQLSNIINTDFLSLKYRFGNCAVQRCLTTWSCVSHDCRGETKICFSHEVRFELSFIDFHIHCVFVEDGLLNLPLFAMTALSCKKHSIVRKTSVLWLFFGNTRRRSCSWTVTSTLRTNSGTFGARCFIQLSSYKYSLMVQTSCYYQATSDSFYSMHLKTLMPKLRMESSTSCSIKGLWYLRSRQWPVGFILHPQ